MEQSESPDDGQEKSSAKVVTGIRMTAALKDELIEEASYADLSVSEYGEVILLNRHKESPETERLTQKVSEQQREIERLTKLTVEQLQEIGTLKALGAAVDGKQTEALKAENERLRKKIEELNNQLAIYSEPRLLYLFENLKGKSDTVENAYGKNFKITYQSPHEVLTALIYNAKLNQ